MFGIVTKKELGKELSKETSKIKESFDKRDKKLESHDSEFKDVRDKINSIDTQLAKIEGMISVVMTTLKPQSQVSVSKSLNQSQSNIETQMIKKLRKTKKSLVINEINNLMPQYSINEIFVKIVKERGLCSKASFYRYMSSLSLNKPLRSETKLRLKK